ncbi:MAG TPA: ABC transporter ATP-binding protein, partial [Bacteroidia bacterium]|nr:ABC transporter ATP-binding protein [Bacteroidia bacterium]
ILDEPTTGLDPQGIIDIRNLINYLRQQGKTILLSSHILSEIELISNRMIIINKGQTVIEGSVTELLSEKALHVTIDVNKPEMAMQLLQQSKFALAQIEIDGTALKLNIPKDDIAQVNKLLAQANLDVFEISFKRPLESYFLKLTHNNK